MSQSTWLDDFKAFVKRGNVLDMAVGVSVGVAFGSIAKSIVDDLIMPVVGLVIGSTDFRNLFVVIQEGSPEAPYSTLEAAQKAGAVTINYGNFINTTVSFFIVAVAMFIAVKLVQRFNSPGEPESTPSQTEPRRCPYCRTDVAEKATRCPACTSELSVEDSPAQEDP